MVAPRALARFNRHVTNPVLSRVAMWLPGFAMIVHVGRTSGREYRTPVNMFRTDDGYLIALTYGPGSDWVRNVLAAGNCTAIIHDTKVELTAPRLIHDPRRTRIPGGARQFLAIVGVTDFLALRTNGRSTDT